MRAEDDVTGLSERVTPVAVPWDGWGELRLFDMATGRALYYDAYRRSWFLLDGTDGAERVGPIRWDDDADWEEAAQERLEPYMLALGDRLPRPPVRSAHAADGAFLLEAA